MNDKFVFQNAKIKNMELRLFTVQAVQRLVDCKSAQEVYKTLADLGYGSGANIAEGDFDALFSCEEERLVAFLKEFNVDRALDVFLLQYDYLNLKAILKAQAQGQSEARLAPSGLYDVNELRLWVADCKDENIPTRVKEAILSVKPLIEAKTATPHEIDVAVDKVMYAHVFDVVKKSGKLALRYFETKIDYVNLLSMFRVKKLGLSYDFFKDGFIDGGTLKASVFERMFEGDDETVRDECKHTPYEKAVFDLLDTGNLVAFEVAMDNALLKMWKNEYNDLFSIAPIVSYYMTRMTELRLAKLIVAGVKNKVNPQIIKERMREIYA